MAVDIKKLKTIQQRGLVVNTTPLLVEILRACGLTFTEIGEILGTSRQNAQQMIKKVDKGLI
jgi:transcriptional regulator